jgi:ABC-2 type transport system permease protein
MRKLLTIAWKEVYSRFGDRNLMIIMFAAPLAISTLVGLAFGGIGRGESPIEGIPVGVINHDHGSEYGVNFGDVLTGFLVEGSLTTSATASTADCPQPAAAQPSESGGMSLTDLIHGSIFDLEAARRLIGEGAIDPVSASPDSPTYVEDVARAAVDRGIMTAVVIIPEGFSTELTGVTASAGTSAPADLVVYGNRGRELAVGIVGSVVDGIASQFVTGNIAIRATFDQVAAIKPQSLAGAGQLDFASLFACAFLPGNDLVRPESLPIQAASEPNALAGILVAVGSAQAMFFALFTGQFGVLSLYQERQDGTLQRMLVSPTPRWAILGGKLVGVFLSVLVQLVVLVIALTAVGSLVEGHLLFIWGTDVVRLALVVISVSIAVSGLGMMLAGVVKGIEQANLIASVLNISLGVLGGAFGFELPRSVSAVSIIYWGRDAFDVLAAGRGDVTLNIVVLAASGLAMFALGLVLFNRRFEL